MTPNEKALSELTRLREASTAFYESPAGLAQLAWLTQFEENLIATAITSPDDTMKLSCLNQAKGIHAFRAYLDTLTKKD